jgi:hypothetical protein
MATPPLVPVVRYREIRPEGADHDALAFRNVAVRLRAVADAFRGHAIDLGLNWSGRAYGRFAEGFAPLPNRLDALAEELDLQAGRIAHKTVTIMETVMVPAGGTHPR